MARSSPNVIITGTPGVGKTSHAEALASTCADLPLTHLAINAVVKERGCHEGWDERAGCWIVDEDQLLDAIEDEVTAGGNIIDWHACDLFPKSWIDLVVVLRTESAVLYDRLAARDYPTAKLDENIDAEIMQVLLEEARDAYDEDIVIELRSDGPEDLESNVERIESWLREWKRNNS